LIVSDDNDDGGARNACGDDASSRDRGIHNKPPAAEHSKPALARPLLAGRSASGPEPHTRAEHRPAAPRKPGADDESPARFGCRRRSRLARAEPRGPLRRLRLRGAVAFSYCIIRRAHSQVLQRHSMTFKLAIIRHLHVPVPPVNKIL
jgi:hypothetical protein